MKQVEVKRDGVLVGLTLSTEGDALFNVRFIQSGQKFSFRISRDQWAKMIAQHHRQLTLRGPAAGAPRTKRGAADPVTLSPKKMGKRQSVTRGKNNFARRKPA